MTTLNDLLRVDGVPKRAHKYAIAILAKMMIDPQIVMSDFEARYAFMQLVSALEGDKSSESLPEYAAGALAILLAKGNQQEDSGLVPPADIFEKMESNLIQLLDSPRLPEQRNALLALAELLYSNQLSKMARHKLVCPLARITR